MLNSRPLDELAARIGQAFENSPAKDIEKNIKQNGITNVILERKEVGEELGKVTINGASNSYVNMSGHGAEVDITCLDEYEHLHPTVLKIDVEGFEMRVLQGAKKILSTRPRLAIEIHSRELLRYGASVQDLAKLIDLESYKVWIQWENGLEPEEWDMRTPIVNRVHLFGIPR